MCRTMFLNYLKFADLEGLKLGKGSSGKATVNLKGRRDLNLPGYLEMCPVSIYPRSIYKLPDRPFHIFRACRSGDWRILCSFEVLRTPFRNYITFADLLQISSGQDGALILNYLIN